MCRVKQAHARIQGSVSVNDYIGQDGSLVSLVADGSLVSRRECESCGGWESCGDALPAIVLVCVCRGVCVSRRVCVEACV